MTPSGCGLVASAPQVCVGGVFVPKTKKVYGPLGTWEEGAMKLKVLTAASMDMGVMECIY